MHHTTIRLVQLLLGVISIAISMGAQAATALNAVGGGWFSHVGEHGEININYSLGGGMDGYTRNNFFLFDRSGVSGTITSATLRIYNPGEPAIPGTPFGYTSSDPTETYALFDVSTSVADLRAGYAIGSAIGQAIFNELGSGQSYGTYAASLADNGHFVEINLNAAGLAALNATSDNFAVGGSITTLDNLVNKESLFVYGYLGMRPDAVQLIVSSVPEPSELALFLAGLGLVGLAVRRGRRLAQLKN